MKSVVAHLTREYLPLTETWLYNNQIANLKRYDPIVISQKRMNLDKFPTQNVYSYEDQNSVLKIGNQLSLRLTGCYLPNYARKIINDKQVKCFHAHFGTEGFRYLKLKKNLNLPMITTFYGFDVSMIPREPLWRKKYTQLFQEGDLFLTEGNYMRNELVKLGCRENKIIVHHLGVDLNTFNFTPRMQPEDGNMKILIAGTFREKKGIPYAVQAFAKVKEDHPNIQLRILGDGPLRKQIESLIMELDIVNSVTLLSYQPHNVFLSEAMNAHIFMSPSITARNGDTEGGAPVAILEAQATGLPVISSYHADIPEVVVDSKSAMLAPEKDVEMLTQHLEYLIENPNVWKEMGLIGRKHVEENYNLTKQVEKLELIYDSLI